MLAVRVQAGAPRASRGCCSLQLYTCSHHVHIHPGLPRNMYRLHPNVQQQQQPHKHRAAVLKAAQEHRYGGGENVINLTDLLTECTELDDVLEDDDSDMPVWEHEHRVRAMPFTDEEMQESRRFHAQQQQQQQQQQYATELLPDPLQAVSDVVSAYSAEKGFREMSAGELSVALTAGGLVDLVLDVRPAAEFAAGPCIPSAVNIPLDQLSEAVKANQLDMYRDGSIAVVCSFGQRSAQATVRLTQVFGFRNVTNVSGGMAAWQQVHAAQGAGGGGCGCGGGGSCSK